MKRKGIFVPTQQVKPSLWTARSTAVRHTLGILMPSRNQIQADPAAEHTHDCFLGRHERVQCGRVWQFLGAYNRSSHVGCLAVAGSLTSHTVCHDQAGPQHGWCPSRAPACVSCREPGHGGRLRWRALLWRRCAVVYFFLYCMMHHAVLGCYTKHMQQPPPSLFPLPPQPSKRGSPSSPSLELNRFFNFYASSRPELPTLGPCSPFFASGVDSPSKKSKNCLDSRPEGLGPGGATRRWPA